MYVYKVLDHKSKHKPSAWIFVCIVCIVWIMCECGHAQTFMMYTSSSTWYSLLTGSSATFKATLYTSSNYKPQSGNYNSTKNS